MTMNRFVFVCVKYAFLDKQLRFRRLVRRLVRRLDRTDLRGTGEPTHHVWGSARNERTVGVDSATE